MTGYARPHARGLIALSALMLLGVGLDLLSPWPLKLLVDHVLIEKPLPEAVSWIGVLPGGASAYALLSWLVGATILLFLARRGVTTIQDYLQAGVGSRMVYDLGADLFDHLQRLSLRFHRRHHAGDLVRRVTGDTRCVRDLVIGVFLAVITSLVSMVAMFLVMWRLDPLLSLLTLLAAIPIGVLIKICSRPMSERSFRQMELEGEIMALAEQTLTALPVVQAFGRESYEDERFRRLSRRTVQAYLRAVLSQLQFRIGTKAATAAGAAVIMAIGGIHVLRGSLSVGSLIVFLSYLVSLYAPLEVLAYLSSGFASAAAGARRVLGVLDASDEVREQPDARALPERQPGERGHVRFESVTFGYEPGRPVLHDITLEAHPGETAALVGTTGAGKSTLVSLVPRFFDPWEGRVTFDGHDLRELRLESLRDQVALVLQEPYLLPLTVADNIAYGRPGADRAAIEAAATAANADGFIGRLPEGYETVLGERGTTLSGGEQQRVAIARAFLKDAPVLILDEPTSALDAETETLLLEALDRLMAGRTTFIIAHRLSTIRRADRIVVIEEGRVAEAGSHKQLLDAGGRYSRFHRIQFGEPGDGAGDLMRKAGC
jgi:ATP-binding cassette subfamily B protein/subfamily B ATP-binding cassette protein MsbA